MNTKINELVNIEELQAAKGILKARFPELIEGYLEDIEKYIQLIDKGLDTQDMQVIARGAHPMKSASAEIGVFTIQKLAEEIEHLANEETVIKDIYPLVEQLKDLFNNVSIHLKLYIKADQ